MQLDAKRLVHVPVQDQVDTMLIRQHTRVLAHDSLGGRDTGSAGARAAVSYITAQCRALGLEPLAGDFRIPVRLNRAIPASRHLTLTLADRTVEFSGADQLFPDFGSWSGRAEYSGTAVFVGQADSLHNAPPARTNDIAVVLIEIVLPIGMWFRRFQPPLILCGIAHLGIGQMQGAARFLTSGFWHVPSDPVARAALDPSRATQRAAGQLKRQRKEGRRA